MTDLLSKLKELWTDEVEDAYQWFVVKGREDLMDEDMGNLLTYIREAIK